MASHVFVIDSRARKARVQTTPATYMNDILQQGCSKLGLNAESYILKYNNKLIDLSRTVRLAGLPAGAQLDLVQGSRSPSVVTVALQLTEADNYRRVTHKFSSTASLWEIIRVVESSEKLNFTERGVPSSQSGAGRLFYEMPVLNIMNRELGTFVDLQKTLASLGVNGGNVLVKLSFRTIDTPLEVAMQEITQYFKPAVKDSITPTESDLRPSQNESALPNNEPQTPNNDVDMVMADTSIISNQTQDNLDSVPDQVTTVRVSPKAAPPVIVAETAPSQIESPDISTSIKVYAPPSSNTPQAAAQSWNETDYVPTMEHATQHQARLLHETKNKRLASDAELAEQQRERQAKQDAVSSVRVRVRLPDQMIIETQFFRGSATGKHVYDFVRAQLQHSNSKFSIRYVDSKGIHVTLMDSESCDLITKAGWKGSVLVNMIWDPSVSEDVRKAPALKADLAEQAKTLEVNLGLTRDGNPDDEKKGGFLNNLFKKENKDKPKLSAGEKEAKLKNLLGFKKK